MMKLEIKNRGISMKELVYIPTNISIRDFMNGSIPFEKVDSQSNVFHNMDKAWQAALNNPANPYDQYRMACVYTLRKDTHRSLLESDIVSVHFAVNDKFKGIDNFNKFVLYKNDSQVLKYDAARIIAGSIILGMTHSERNEIINAYKTGNLDMQLWINTGGSFVPTYLSDVVQDNIGHLLQKMPFEQRSLMTECFMNAYKPGCYQIGPVIHDAYMDWSAIHTSSADVSAEFANCMFVAKINDQRHNEELQKIVPVQEVSDVTLKTLENLSKSVLNNMNSYINFKDRYEEIFTQLDKPCYEDIAQVTAYAAEELINNTNWMSYIKSTSGSTVALVKDIVHEYLQTKNLYGNVTPVNEQASHCAQKMMYVLDTLSLKDRQSFMNAVNKYSEQGLDSLSVVQKAYDECNASPVTTKVFEEAFSELKDEISQEDIAL